MVLVIDNYDSFTWNLVQYLGELGASIQVVRNDKIDTHTMETLQPDYLVVSPGPGTPTEAGASCTILGTYSRSIPTLGVCLGHQCIGQIFGGKVTNAPRLMHGKTSQIRHNAKGIFRNLPSPFTATRYHSLVVKEEGLSKDVEITAWAEDDNCIMGVQHKTHPIYGVQFHPESILTNEGRQLLKNFLDLYRPTAAA